MTGETQIKIDLNEKDAQLFLEFQKNYELFSTLVSSGVFNIRNGNAIMSFNPEGRLDSIQITIVGFKRGLPIVQQIKLI